MIKSVTHGHFGNVIIHHVLQGPSYQPTLPSLLNLQGKIQMARPLTSTLYSKDLLSCPFKHPSPCIFYIYQGSFYVLPLTTVIVYLPHLPNSLLILWGKICVLLRKTTWVLKSILAYLALFPAVAVCLWANYLTSPRLSYHIPKMETVMFLHWSIRLSE